MASGTSARAGGTPAIAITPLHAATRLAALAANQPTTAAP